MPRYKTLGMMKGAGFNKDLSDLMNGARAAPYLLANQRIPYLVTTNMFNCLVQGNRLLDTSSSPSGWFIFVMDGEGNIYSADKTMVQHHSAFLAGGPVAAAGAWRVEDGAVQELNNSSGHYAPPLDYTRQILNELEERGVYTAGIQTTWTGSTSKRLAKLGHKFDRLGPNGVVKSRF